MTTKLSSKGQIVIPVSLRRKYDLKSGSAVELMDIGGEIVVIPLTVKNPIDAAKGLLKGGLTTREIMRRVRAEERGFEQKKRKS